MCTWQKETKTNRKMKIYPIHEIKKKQNATKKEYPENKKRALVK